MCSVWTGCVRVLLNDIVVLYATKCRLTGGIVGLHCEYFRLLIYSLALFSISFSMHFTIFSISLSFSYWNITAAA